MNEMKPIDALQLLNQVSQSVALDRAGHLAIIQAINTLQAFIQENSSEEDLKPNEEKDDDPVEESAEK